MKLLLLSGSIGYDKDIVALVKLLQGEFDIEITELSGTVVMLHLLSREEKETDDVIEV